MQDQNTGDLAGDKVALPNGFKGADFFDEVLPVAVAMAMKFQIDHRGQWPPDQRRINHGDSFTNDPRFAQFGDTVQTGRGRQANMIGKGCIRDIRVFLLSLFTIRQSQKSSFSII